MLAKAVKMIRPGARAAKPPWHLPRNAASSEARNSVGRRTLGVADDNLNEMTHHAGQNQSDGRRTTRASRKGVWGSPHPCFASGSSARGRQQCKTNAPAPASARRSLLAKAAGGERRKGVKA